MIDPKWVEQAERQLRDVTDDPKKLYRLLRDERAKLLAAEASLKKIATMNTYRYRGSLDAAISEARRALGDGGVRW